MSGWEKLRWKNYLGEEAPEAESEDEDYIGVRKDGYTRDMMLARKAKLEVVEKFEKRVSEVRSLSRIEVLRAPSHRSLAASVRPCEGAEVIVTYSVSRGEQVVAVGEREALRVGNPAENEEWRRRLDELLRDMRRGEKLRAPCADGLTTVEVELNSVCEMRMLSPSASSEWASYIQGYARKRRLVCGSSIERATWGDSVLVRLFEHPPPDACIDAIRLALAEETPREIVVGAGIEREGLETAVAAMKPDEIALVFAGGELVLTEAQAANNLEDEADWSAAVQLLAIKRRSRRVECDAADDEARNLKHRGGILAAAGRWRRAEAAYTRAVHRLDDAYANKTDEDVRQRVEDELVVPLLLNIAVCARKRLAHADEENLITKAMRLKHAQDAAFRAKSYVRRAAARIDLAKWSDAQDDLRLAAANAKQTNNKAVLKDVARQLARLNTLRKAEHATARNDFAGAEAAFCNIVELPEHDTIADAHVKQRKPAPLLYQKEIEDRLKAQKPWEHDP